MSKTISKTQKTIIIPPNSSERFINLSELGEEKYFGENIFMAALCSHKSGYNIIIPSAKRFDLHFCFEGRYQWAYNDISGVLNPGEVIIFPAGGCQMINCSQDSKSIFFLLNPQPVWGEPELYHNVSPDGELLRQLMLKSEQLSSRNDDDEIIKSSLRKLIFFVLKSEIAKSRTAKNESVKDHHGEIFNSLKSKLILHPEKTWTVTEMAKYCRTSESHFYALCRKYYHCSPYKLLKNLRLEQAQELLTRTAYSIKTIATLCGYNTPYSFSNSFSRKFGISPEQFRLEQKKHL